MKLNSWEMPSVCTNKMLRAITIHWGGEKVQRQTTATEPPSAIVATNLVYLWREWEAAGPDGVHGWVDLVGDSGTTFVGDYTRTMDGASHTNYILSSFLLVWFRNCPWSLRFREERGEKLKNKREKLKNKGEKEERERDLL